MRCRGNLYPGEQGAIISEETFKQAQEILASNRPPGRGSTPKPNSALLKGLLRCKACDSSMYDTYSVKDGQQKYYYYICSKAAKRGYTTCPTRSLNLHLTDEKIVEFIREVTGDKRLTPGA